MQFDIEYDFEKTFFIYKRIKALFGERKNKTNRYYLSHKSSDIDDLPLNGGAEIWTVLFSSLISIILSTSSVLLMCKFGSPSLEYIVYCLWNLYIGTLKMKPTCTILCVWNQF